MQIQIKVTNETNIQDTITLIKENADKSVVVLKDDNTDDAYLINVIEAILSKTNLTNLDLSSLKLGDKGIIALYDAFKNNNILTSLNLSDNLIEEQGTKLIANIINLNSSIRSLHLSDNPGLSEALGYIALGVQYKIVH